MSVPEILKKGMSTEVWGQRFYQQAIERTRSEDGKRVFQSLVEEEGKHLDILRGQYAALSAEKDWVSLEEAQAMAASVEPTDIFPQAGATGQLIPDAATDEQAIELAMDFERRGFNLYDEAAKNADSLEEKAVWAYLAKAEDRHYAFLQETLEYLTNDGVWYFDDLEKPFFEG